jgi:hypothetical protein
VNFEVLPFGIPTGNISFLGTELLLQNLLILIKEFVVLWIKII